MTTNTKKPKKQVGVVELGGGKTNANSPTPDEKRIQKLHITAKKTKNGKAKKGTKSAAKSRAGKKKAKSGKPFEKRAQEALQFVHAKLKAEHDVVLPMSYDDWSRQFDIVLRDREQVHKVFEAKDYGGRVAFEKVEAFETKVREMKVPPLDGAGLISSQGFQEGPIARARALGDRSMVRHLYQLREVQEADWQNLYKSMQLALLARSLDPHNVRLTLVKGETVPADCVSFEADRKASFLYDAAGRIKAMSLIRSMINYVHCP